MSLPGAISSATSGCPRGSRGSISMAQVRRQSQAQAEYMAALQAASRAAHEDKRRRSSMGAQQQQQAKGRKESGCGGGNSGGGAGQGTNSPDNNGNSYRCGKAGQKLSCIILLATAICLHLALVHTAFSRG